jgi:hypothetical protein
MRGPALLLFLLLVAALVPGGWEHLWGEAGRALSAASGAGLLDPPRLLVDLQSDGRFGTMIFLLFALAIMATLLALHTLRLRRNEKKSSQLKALVQTTDRTPVLAPGEAYLVAQGNARALKVFDDELKKGYRGLCISRTHPRKLREAYELRNATLVWLSAEGGGDELQDLSVKVSKFVYGRTKGIVLLDGLEYLILQNDFPRVMKFLQNIKDMLQARGAKMLLPVDLHALVEGQRALLTREFKTL